MRTGRSGGFTLLEVLVTIVILSVVGLLVFAPMVNSLNFVNREASILAMDMNADRALNEVTVELRSALLPVATYPEADVPVATLQIENFQDLLNSRLGFGQNGVIWHGALAAGTDFVPFSVPVDFGGDGDALDSNMVPELGIILPDGTEVAAGSYTVTGSRNVLDDTPGCLHPSLALLAPGDFGNDVLDPTTSNVDLLQPRFAQNLAFPAGRDNGYAVIRFVPYRTGDTTQDNFVILSEAALSGPQDSPFFDLNGDGTNVDTFALGSIEIDYADGGGTVIRRRVSGPMVLLQINRNAPSWKPLFQLVRYETGDPNSPNQGNFTGTPIDKGGYALLIRFLMYDRMGQEGAVLAFDAKVPYLVREYETLVKLRNLATSTRVEP